MAKIKNLRENPPKKKSELTKESMLLYMKDKSVSKDEKIWFFNLMESNRKEKVNNLTHETGIGYDLTKIREEFAKKYFPELYSTKKKYNKAKTFEDRLKELLED
jgi:hypothetical protein